MNKIARIISVSFGAFAGIGGIEHGYFEWLQGYTRPAGLMISSIGARRVCLKLFGMRVSLL